MKNVMTLMLSIFIGLSCLAQGVKSLPELTAGDYLIKAGKQGNAAISVGLFGIALSTSLLLTKSDNVDQAAYAIGGASALISIILEYSSNSNLKKAGKIMNSKHMGLLINDNGMGIRYCLARK